MKLYRLETCMQLQPREDVILAHPKDLQVCKYTTHEKQQAFIQSALINVLYCVL